jgi:hypothetical protein
MKAIRVVIGIGPQANAVANVLFPPFDALLPLDLPGEMA